MLTYEQILQSGDYRDSIGRRVVSVDQFHTLSASDQRAIREKYEQAAQRERYAAWDEEKHPRGDDGKFGSGGGGEKKSTDGGKKSATGDKPQETAFDPNPPQTGPFDKGSPHGDAYDEVVKEFPHRADLAGRLIAKGYTTADAKEWLRAYDKIHGKDD